VAQERAGAAVNPRIDMEKEKEKFNAERFLELLIEDVVSYGRAGKNFVADPAELGPRLIGLQTELEARPALAETDSQLPDEDDPSQSSS
jgi:hypothetical protein